MVRRLTIKRGFQGGNTVETNRGGGIAVFTVVGSDGGTTLENLILSDNNASLIAGGAYVGGQPVIVRNNLLVGNGAPNDSAFSTDQQRFRGLRQQQHADAERQSQSIDLCARVQWQQRGLPVEQHPLATTADAMYSPPTAR